MSNKELNLFKLEYHWYEGEYWSTIMGSTKSPEEIEKELREIVEQLRITEEDGDYLPNAYHAVICALEERGYFTCRFVSSPLFEIDDGKYNKDKPNTYIIKRKVESFEWKQN